MAKTIDKQKRAWGGAIKRTEPSKAAVFLSKLVRGRTLDYGCGWGFDADHFKWESFDPYYRPKKLQGPFDTIVCLSVINALSKNNRTKVIQKIRDLLAEDGTAYFSVPRDIPTSGKMGLHHSFQNYVVLTLPSIFSDKSMEIYVLKKTSKFDDKTMEFLTPRDRRVMRS